MRKVSGIFSKASLFLWMQNEKNGKNLESGWGEGFSQLQDVPLELQCYV